MIFILHTIQKYIKDDHRARDLPHGAWVSINFRGHGSGKRGRATGAKDDKLTKAAKIDMKKQELMVVMLQLKELNHSGSFHIMNHINRSLVQGDRVIDGALPHLPVAILQQIRSEMDGNNDVVLRCNSLAKFFFTQDMATITSTNSAMKLCEEALKLITTVKLYENYLDRNGRMSWDDMRDKVDEAITNHVNPDLNPEQTGFEPGADRIRAC